MTLYAPLATFGALTGSTPLGRVSSVMRVDRSIGSARGLLCPQTTIDAPSIDDLLALTTDELATTLLHIPAELNCLIVASLKKKLLEHSASPLPNSIFSTLVMMDGLSVIVWVHVYRLLDDCSSMFD